MAEEQGQVNGVVAITRQEILLAQILEALQSNSGGGSTPSFDIEGLQLADVGNFKKEDLKIKVVDYVKE